MEKLRKIYNFFYLSIFLIIFKTYVFFSVSKKSKVIIFDIDNTLAATRESGHNDFLRLKPIKNLCNICGQINSSDDYEVIFMSARPLSSIFTTKKWLNQNIISTKKKKLFLVRSPMQKVTAIHKCLASREKLLIDDMSYNVEGDIYLFKSALEKIDKNIKYLGLNFINKAKTMHIEKVHKMIDAMFEN